MAKAKVPPVLALAIIIAVGMLLAVSIPFFQSSQDFLSFNPIEQYVIWNLGVGLLFVGFFGVLISAALGKSYSLWNIFVHGLATFAVFSFVIDNLSPPFALNAAGEFIIPAGQTLEGTSVDYMLAWTYSTQLGIQGPALFWAVYLVTPIVAIVAFALALGPKRLLKIYGGAV